jgi:hypothetical protein
MPLSASTAWLVLASLASVTSAISIPASSKLAILSTASSSSPQDFSLSSLSPCLQASYYGAYGGEVATQDHVFMPSAGCLTGMNADRFAHDGGWGMVDLVEGEGRIIWVGQAGVERMGREVSEMREGMLGSWDTIRSLSMAHVDLQGSQHVLSSNQETIRLLHSTAHSLLLQVPRSLLPHLDTFLPSHLVPIALPSSSGANTQTLTLPLPVPAKFAKHLADITANLTFSPLVDKVVTDGINLDDLRRNVRYLTGEGPSGIESRHSFTPGALVAATWIKGRSGSLWCRAMYSDRRADHTRQGTSYRRKLHAYALPARILAQRDLPVPFPPKRHVASQVSCYHEPFSHYRHRCACQSVAHTSHRAHHPVGTLRFSRLVWPSPGTRGR